MSRPLVGGVIGGSNRAPKLTATEFKAVTKKEQLEQSRKTQAKARELWKDQKSIIDAMDVQDLSHYMDSLDPSEFRAGMVTMKVNRYEYCLFILEREKRKKGSLRELFVGLFKGFYEV